MPRLIEKHNQAEQADSLAAYLPGGRLFDAGTIDGTKIRQLLLGMAKELGMSEGYLKTISNEYDIAKTTLFIDEWEAAVGIPDSCFKGNGTIEQRRQDVLIKLAALGVQTSEDLIELGSIIGVVIYIDAGYDVAGVFPATFPFIFFSTTTEARFTIVVNYSVTGVETFPLTFPFTFGTNEIAVLECLFNRLKPANCQVLFRQVI